MYHYHWYLDSSGRVVPGSTGKEVIIFDVHAGAGMLPYFIPLTCLEAEAHHRGL